MKNKLYELVGAMKNDEMVCIASRPGLGKSKTICELADKLLDENKNIVFFSLEAGETSIRARMKNSTNESLHIVDVPNLAIEQLSSYIESDIDYVFIDYIQLLNCDLSTVSKSLKELQEQLKIPFVVTYQLSKSFDGTLASTNLSKEVYSTIYIIKEDGNYYDI